MSDYCTIKIVSETGGTKHTSTVWKNYCEDAKSRLNSVTLKELLDSRDTVKDNTRFKQRVIEDLAKQGALLTVGCLVFTNREQMTEFVLKYS